MTPHAELRERVLEANRAIVRAGLVVLTFGNASGIDRSAGVMAIKPSGVPYDELGPGSMVVVDLESGAVVDGDAATVVGHAHAPRSVPALRRDRRRRPHALPVRDRLGPGPARAAVPRDDARGSLPRSGAGDPPAHPRGDRRRLRGAHRRRDRRDDRGPAPRPPRDAGRARRLARTVRLGRGRRARRSRTRSRSRPSRGRRCTRCCSRPARSPSPRSCCCATSCASTGPRPTTARAASREGAPPARRGRPPPARGAGADGRRGGAARPRNRGRPLRLRPALAGRGRDRRRGAGAAARARARVRRHGRVRTALRASGSRSTRRCRAAAAPSASPGCRTSARTFVFAGHGSTDGALRTLLAVAGAARAPAPRRPRPTPRRRCSSRSASRCTRSTSATSGRERARASSAAARSGCSSSRRCALPRPRQSSPPTRSPTARPRRRRSARRTRVHPGELAGIPCRAASASTWPSRRPGEDGALADAIEAVRPGGRVVLVGIPDGDRTSFVASAARRKGLTLLLCRRMEPADLPRAIRLAESGRVDLASLVGERYPLSAWREAFAALVDRRGAQGRRRAAGRRRGGAAMSAERYAVGVDFGTESGRAVLVSCADGSEIGTNVYPYRNGVIDERLPAPHDGVRAGARLGAAGPRGLSAHVPGGRAARCSRRRASTRPT